jgi:Rap1a immunity proteins
MACMGYMRGFTSGVDFGVGFVKSATKEKALAPFCVPEEVGNAQLVRVVLKYIRDNPEVAHQRTAALIVKALGKAYPCHSK